MQYDFTTQWQCYCILYFISYITKGSYDAKPSTPNDIQVDDNEISLVNDDQAEVGDLLVINNEVMKVLSKDSNKYTVQRGFNNTEPKKHLSSASVKKIKNPENYSNMNLDNFFFSLHNIIVFP